MLALTRSRTRRRSGCRPGYDRNGGGSFVPGRSSDYVSMPDRSDRRLLFSSAGRGLRESLKMVTPKRTDIYIAFDRLLWQPKT